MWPDLGNGCYRCNCILIQGEPFSEYGWNLYETLQVSTESTTWLQRQRQNPCSSKSRNAKDPQLSAEGRGDPWWNLSFRFLDSRILRQYISVGVHWHGSPSAMVLIFASLTFTWENSNPPDDGIRRRGILWWWWHKKEQPWIGFQGPFQKKSQRPRSSLLPCKGTGSGGHLRPEKFALPGHITHWRFDFGLPILENSEKFISSVNQLPSLWCHVIAIEC